MDNKTLVCHHLKEKPLTQKELIWRIFHADIVINGVMILVSRGPFYYYQYTKTFTQLESDGRISCIGTDAEGEKVWALTPQP